MNILGVDINPFKSIHSYKGVFEFAKRIITLNTEITPVGPKNILLVIKSPINYPSVLLDAVNKGYFLTSETVSDLFTNLVPFVKKESKLANNLLWTVVGPFGFILNPSGLSGDLPLNSSLTGSSLNILLQSLDVALKELQFNE